MTQVILPGKTIGMVGGGQLGRMVGLAARHMGYGFVVFSPESGSPAGQIADQEFVGSFDDLILFAQFAEAVDVVTFEFENIPCRSMQLLESLKSVHPSSHILETTQHRLREKTFLREAGIPVARFFAVNSIEELETAAASIGFNGVLKTAAFGYDGKGQCRIKSKSDLTAAWAVNKGVPCVLEEWVSFKKEISVMVARNALGEVAVYPAVENIHVDHILHMSISPARIDPAFMIAASELAVKIADKLKLVGILGVEMFYLDNGSLVVNELAPRTHNSGHHTIEASITSQFEQQIRAVCGLPLGPTYSVSPAVMVNILGDAWSDGVPPWDRILTDFPASLHLYGKSEPRPKRKMGHLTFTGSSQETLTLQAESVARKYRFTQF
ncbi:MAG: 5-(carboxyamino)imidazole ribonucleotide synthase [Verrucomicrobiota bacterium]|nr:5-(carboxyamino)imidazole ribonucleotide synthase [Verrucomicrobiota bacterium]